MGGGEKTQQVVNKADPWAGQQPYISDALVQAQGRYQDSNSPAYYPGQQTVGFAPETLQGQKQIVDMSTGPGQALAQGSLEAAAFNVGEGRNVNSNPFFQQAVQGAIRPVFQQLQDAGGPIQAGRNAAQAAGQYGSNRQGIAEGLSTARATQQAFDTTSAMSAAEYKAAQDRALQTAIAGQTIQQGAVQPGVSLDAVGQQNRAYQQALLDQRVAEWNYNQQLPDLKLDQYINRVSGGYGGSATSTSPIASPNKALTVAGAAMSGASLGFMVSGMNPAGAAWGAGIGTVLGLLASS